MDMANTPIFLSSYDEWVENQSKIDHEIICPQCRGDGVYEHDCHECGETSERQCDLCDKDCKVVPAQLNLTPYEYRELFSWHDWSRALIADAIALYQWNRTVPLIRGMNAQIVFFQDIESRKMQARLL